MVNANAPVTPILPVPATDATNTGSGTNGASGLGFKARTGSRSSPKTGSRLHNAFKPNSVRAAVADGTVTTKQHQSKEQAEKKNQAISQLRKLLVQGNKRVEALATVIQHLFTEVLNYFYVHQTILTLPTVEGKPPSLIYGFLNIIKNISVNTVILVAAGLHRLHQQTIAYPLV